MAQKFDTIRSVVDGKKTVRQANDEHRKQDQSWAQRIPHRTSYGWYENSAEKLDK